MNYADKTGARYPTVIGNGELETSKITLKNMQTGDKVECALDVQSICDIVRK